MKLKSLIAFFGVLLTFYSTSTFSVFAAGNVSDTPFSLDGNAVLCTDVRAKLNTTSTYVYLHEGPVTGTTFVEWASVDASGTVDVFNATRKIGTHTYQGVTSLIYSGQKRLIVNYAKEMGRNYVFLTAYCPNSIYSMPFGVWSPDSAGTYPLAN